MSGSVLDYHIIVGKSFSTTSTPKSTAIHLASPIGFTEKEKSFGPQCSWVPPNYESTSNLGHKSTKRVESRVGTLSFSGFIVS
jgi:hypothetical protein